MATYISLINFTQQGLSNIQDTTRRAVAVKATAKKMGLKVKDIYWTLGAYDGAIVFEAPDDETATAAMLAVASLGNVRTQTLRAYTAPEMDAILAKAAAGG